MKDDKKSELIPNPLNPRSGEEIRYFSHDWDTKLTLDLCRKKKVQEPPDWIELLKKYGFSKNS